MKIKHYKKILAVVTLAITIPAIQAYAAEVNTTDETFIGQYNDVFLQAYQYYSGLTEKKAFALAVDENRSWAYGLGYNYSNQADADRRALFECNMRIPAFNVGTQCRLYAVGNKVVW